MEKLIELLNEYKPQADFIYKGGIRKEIPWDKDVIMNKDLLIISKQFWFIEWLVQNDKIDTDELLGIYWETSQSIWEPNKYELYSEYKRLLMLLALQDDPIKFLISMLN